MYFVLYHAFDISSFIDLKFNMVWGTQMNQQNSLSRI